MSGVRYEGNIIILPDQTLEWPLVAIEDLSLEALQPVLEAEPSIEILLIGCGKSMAFIDEGLRNQLRAQGIIIDSMDSGAAVRTYNVLLLEKRRVAAALIAS